jgi:hypothetical protein
MFLPALLAKNIEIVREELFLPQPGHSIPSSASLICLKASKQFSQSKHKYSYIGILRYLTQIL